MGRNVFISFRHSDGKEYKDKLVKLFSNSNIIRDFSEDKDRSSMTEETIKKYLYQKLAKSSVTIVILTKDALDHKRDIHGKIDDWMYDEIRYSLENRDNNLTNGLIAVYTDDVEELLIRRKPHICDICKSQRYTSYTINYDNIIFKNRLNIKDEEKNAKCKGVYDSRLDSYCSLFSWDDFIDNFQIYIEDAFEKKENSEKYKLVKKML